MYFALFWTFVYSYVYICNPAATLNESITFCRDENGSSVSNATSNSGFFLRASTDTSIAIMAVSPHM